MIEELSRILTKKFHFSKKRLSKLQERLEKSTTLVVPSKQVTAIKTDEADNRILEAAVEARADYIVSGDKDLLRLRRFGDIAIVSPKTFFELSKLSLKQ